MRHLYNRIEHMLEGIRRLMKYKNSIFFSIKICKNQAEIHEFLSRQTKVSSMLSNYFESLYLQSFYIILPLFMTYQKGDPGNYI